MGLDMHGVLFQFYFVICNDYYVYNMFYIFISNSSR